MGVVLAGNVGRSQAAASRCARLSVAALLCVASCGWAADDGAGETLVAQAYGPGIADRARPQVEVTARSLPRFDSLDGATRSSRVDLTVIPPRRSALGLSLGITSLAGSTLANAAPLASGSPSVDLGLHLRHTLDNDYRFDVLAWRRVPPTDAMSLIQSREPTYGARVELPLNPQTGKGFVADRGFLGLQLESGARITVKRSYGQPMLYYRNRF